ncbi:glycosyltransferase [Streptomyces canus]|uniref:glycosyltransferase n=1 Tax=Streptomyces canus TaxID=58343 RepID=UPI0035946DD4
MARALRAGKPAALIPLATSAGNEQAHNARHLAHNGAGTAGAPPTGTPRHSEEMRNSNSGRSHGTAGGFANAVPVRTAPTRW